MENNTIGEMTKCAQEWFDKGVKQEQERVIEKIEGMKKEKVTANFYANGGIRWNQGYNKAITAVLDIIRKQK